MHKSMRAVRRWVASLGSFLLILPVTASAQLDTTTVGTASGLAKTSIATLVSNLMKWGLYMVGFLGVLAFVISGIWYLTSAGDEDRIDRAKETMIYGIVGVLVALIGLIIVNAVSTFLVGTNTTF